MAKTYRITIEYTTTEDMDSGPDYWDWPEILDLNPTRETFGVWTEKVETNQDHLREIKEQNEFADA